MNYQEKVSTRADVRELFEKVKKDPTVSRYRGYTETRSYGWDEAADDYVKCEGEVWFDNPAHDPNFVADGVPNEERAELLDEQLLAREATIAELSEECTRLRAKAEEMEERLAAADAERQAAVEKKDAAVSILCHLRQILETVLAYRSE